MKTIEQIKKEYKSNTLDGRDLNRLAEFLSEEDLKEMGIEFKDEYKGKHQPKEFTEKNIINQLRKDVAFGFEKALDKRGISSSLMFEVVMMWNWILENELMNWPDTNYAMYGLPLFKATALLYGFDNPIGDDAGSEFEYSDYDGGE